MNPEKAREYFSAYYEGTLEKGLSETFERALRTDAQVQAEYRSFERLMGELDLLKEPVPEPELDLHEVISRRLDRHIYEQKRRVSFSIVGWWKSAALGGLAMVALVATILQMKSGGGPSVSPLGLVPTATNKVEIRATSDGFAALYRSPDKKTVQVKAADGAVLKQETLEAGSITFPLDNPNQNAVLLQIEIVGEKQATFVALPGKRMQSVRSGEGTIKDLALAMAGFYREPVMFTDGEAVSIKWEFESGEATSAAEKALAQTSYSVVKNSDGVISIQPN